MDARSMPKPCAGGSAELVPSSPRPFLARFPTTCWTDCSSDALEAMGWFLRSRFVTHLSVIVGFLLATCVPLPALSFMPS